MLKLIARFFVAGLLMIATAAAGLFWWARQPLRLPATALEVTIVPGSSMRALSEKIFAAGVPVQPLLLNLLARAERRATRLKAGSYAMTAPLTPDTLLDKLERGDVIQLELVIPEGWTFKQMRAAIASDPDIRQTVREMSDAQLLAAIGAPDTHPEGLFFPDTYHFSRAATDLDLYRRAFRAQQKRLADAWAGRAADLPLATPYEALILASIVEKETGRADDRAQVAAVLLNRLKRGMLLQTDPTVIYGMGARFEGNLRKADLAADTAYNTYVRSGLPPTPIALPGAAALAAALNPARSDALYFVARGDGSSEFSENLSDHNRAVDRYQLSTRHGTPQ